MRLIKATALGSKQVRVRFDVPPPADQSRAPANWAFVSLGPQPSASVVPTGVGAIEGIATEFDVFTDIEISPRVRYRVTTSLGGLDPGGNSAEFDAFVAPSPADRTLQLGDALPALNFREDDTGDLRAFIACLQEIVDLLLVDVDRWVDIFDPDVAPEAFLNLMLTDLGSPFGRLALSELDKRRLVRVLTQVYQQKGTRVGIENIVRFLLLRSAEVVPLANVGMRLGNSKLNVDWILGFGRPFSFRLKLQAQPPLSPTEVDRFRQLVDYIKPAHIRFETLLLAQDPPRNLVAVTAAPGTIRLTWTPPAAGSPSGYRVFWRLFTGVKTFNGTPIDVPASPLVISGIPHGQTRYFVVVALDSSSPPIEGFESNEVSATAT